MAKAMGKKLQQINEINATFIEMKFAVKTKLKKRNKKEFVTKRRKRTMG